MKIHLNWLAALTIASLALRPAAFAHPHHTTKTTMHLAAATTADSAVAQGDRPARIVSDSGDIVVCTWNPGRIAYWRRLPPGGN